MNVIFNVYESPIDPERIDAIERRQVEQGITLARIESKLGVIRRLEKTILQEVDMLDAETQALVDEVAATKDVEASAIVALNAVEAIVAKLADEVAQGADAKVAIATARQSLADARAPLAAAIAAIPADPTAPVIPPPDAPPADDSGSAPAGDAPAQ